MDISDNSEEKESQTLGEKTPSETEEKSAKSGRFEYSSGDYSIGLWEVVLSMAQSSFNP